MVSSEEPCSEGQATNYYFHSSTISVIAVFILRLETCNCASSVCAKCGCRIKALAPTSRREVFGDFPPRCLN